MKRLSGDESRNELKRLGHDAACEAVSIEVCRDVLWFEESVASCYGASYEVLERIGSSEVLVYVLEYGIWPSRELPALYRGICRVSSACDDPVSELPGHLFGANEALVLREFLVLLFLTGWGGVVRSRSRLFMFSHDGWVGFA